MPKKTIIIFFVLFVSVLFFQNVYLFSDDPSGSGEPSEKKNDESRFTEVVEVVGNVPVVKTIQSVWIIKQEEFRKFNFDNLKSILQLTPGLLTLSSGSFGQVSSTTIRGSKPSQVLYVVDGIKLRDAAGISGVNLGVLSPFVVDKVEVVRGPLSNIYGSDAMGGVISITTASKDEMNITASLASHGSYTGGFSGATTALKNMTLGLSVNTQRFSDNVVNDLFKNTALSTRAIYKKDKLETGIQFFGNFTQSGIPFDSLGAQTPDRNYKQNYAILALPFVYRFNNHSMLDVKLSYTGTQYTFNDAADLWSPYFMSQFTNKEVETTYTGHFFSEILDLHAGIDYSNQNILNENDTGKTLDNMKMNYFSGFASTGLNLDAFQLSASLRYDKYKDIKANVSPQIGVSYLIAHRLKLRASYSQSFLAPFVSQIVNPWGRPNPNLKPEKGKSYEIGAEFYSGPFTFSTTYFNTKYKDMIDWVTIDWNTYEGQYQNIQNVNTHGIECAVTVSPFKQFTLSGAYTYLHTEDLSTQKPLARKPKHTVSAFAAYACKRFTLSANMIYVGQRDDFNFAIWPPDIKNPAYNVFDVNLIVPIFENLNVFGKLTNAFDKTYQEIMGYPAPSRRVEVGFTYKIN
ncbi:MAG: TonB-dependent receptor plug domain-containing protein [Candidatus Omnitrophota bacterium]